MVGPRGHVFDLVHDDELVLGWIGRGIIRIYVVITDRKFAWVVECDDRRGERFIFHYRDDDRGSEGQESIKAKLVTV